MSLCRLRQRHGECKGGCSVSSLWLPTEDMLRIVRSQKKHEGLTHQDVQKHLWRNRGWHVPRQSHTWGVCLLQSRLYVEELNDNMNPLRPRSGVTEKCLVQPKTHRHDSSRLLNLQKIRSFVSSITKCWSENSAMISLFRTSMNASCGWKAPFW